MTDRELLELAAKAAGIEIEWKKLIRSRSAEFQTIRHTKHCGFYAKGKEWNPLTDDGDALRLAVKLGMHIIIDNENGLVRVYCQSFAKPEEVYGDGKQGDDPDTATRRAIVRAAAEIGKMKNSAAWQTN